MSSQGKYSAEINKRRTFAIISHPDAGKTTLTEKLLLQGGAIHLAGEVRAKGERRRTRSDWMAIEQRRGISISTSVMMFEHNGNVYNLLDTPGHEDFSEDTYRTLTAVDSAIMVLDAAKGIEAQTLKLFEICRLRDIPVITFVNKVDRETRDLFELFDEISEKLALDTVPFVWPIGTGRDFCGCYDIRHQQIIKLTEEGSEIISGDLESDALKGLFATPADYQKFCDEVEMSRDLMPAFSQKSYLEGHMTPVVFGSALKNFGILQLLDVLDKVAPSPLPKEAETRMVDPHEDKATGVVFKVQANMDPNHRDRVAFLRLCSGRFERGQKLYHTRSGKQMVVHNPVMFFAKDRVILDDAYAGDIVGIPNHGALRVGDTLTEGEVLSYKGISGFAPEILRRVELKNPLQSKQLEKALTQLAEEGVVQVFKMYLGGSRVVGVVGALQLDVLSERLRQEYKVDIALDVSSYQTIAWLTADDKEELKKFLEKNHGVTASDSDGYPVFMARNAWDMNFVQDQNPKIKFHRMRDISLNPLQA